MKSWNSWHTIHQPFELNYHTKEGIAWCRDDERFWTFWSAIFDFIQPKGRKLDVGCGPRPPFGKDSTAIDPLADHYRELVPEWWEGIESHSIPAERYTSALGGAFDTVLCWNCLDHTIGWQQILTNLSAYGDTNATYAIATDFKPPSVGHPGFGKGEFFKELGKHFKVVDFAENFQERDVALKCERI